MKATARSFTIIVHLELGAPINLPNTYLIPDPKSHARFIITKYPVHETDIEKEPDINCKNEIVPAYLHRHSRQYHPLHHHPYHQISAGRASNYNTLHQ